MGAVDGGEHQPVAARPPSLRVDTLWPESYLPASAPVGPSAAPAR